MGGETMKTTLLFAGSLMLSATTALAAPSCGANTGAAATGTPIKVGGIFGNAAPCDFSASTTAARAYFDCVNANGGIGGGPLANLPQNDQWEPRLARPGAPKLLE